MPALLLLYAASMGNAMGDRAVSCFRSPASPLPLSLLDQVGYGGKLISVFFEITDHLRERRYRVG